MLSWVIFFPKTWNMLVFNLTTLFSFVSSKKTKMQFELWMISFNFSVKVFPWKTSQLPVSSSCFQLARAFNFMFSLLLIIPWCVDYKSMPLVLILEFGNQQMHACFGGKKIRQKSREFSNQRKTDRCHLFSLFSQPCTFSKKY